MCIVDEPGLERKTMPCELDFDLIYALVLQCANAEKRGRYRINIFKDLIAGYIRESSLLNNFNKFSQKIKFFFLCFRMLFFVVD